MKRLVVAIAVIALAAACKDKKAEESAEQMQMSDSAHMMSPTSEMEITDSSTMEARPKE
jgi:nitrous oxide reductase accessory protein NosL